MIPGGLTINGKGVLIGLQGTIVMNYFNNKTIGIFRVIG